MKKLAALLAGILLLAAPGPFNPHSARLQDGESIIISAKALPLPADYVGLGALKPVAALQLSSKDVRFGGWSGLEAQANGDVLLLSDRAFVLRGKLKLNKDGVDGFEGARIGLLRDADGQQPSAKRGDSEGVARLRNGLHVVSFELIPRLEFYDFDKDGEKALPVDGPPLAQVEKLSNNQELEAVTVLADGSILVGSERGIGGDDEALLWRVDAKAKATDKTIEPLAKIKLPSGFSLTDVAGAPDGSFYALFRSYLPIIGARGQIWRFKLVEANGKVEAIGEKLASLETPFPVDNYEGLALTKAPNGAPRLYVISDDNYRFEQRTILLAFDVVEKAESKKAK